MGTGTARLTRVPENFITYTCSPVGFDEFTRSGREVFTMLDLAAQQFGEKDFGSFERILDFGCGAGRVMQFIPSGPERLGCDVNGNLISFVQDEFPDIRVYQNNFVPPLIYPDGFFDLVYAYSVFSHLTEENERAWLRELARIGRPGCLYLLTVQGDWMIEATLGQERQAAEKAGFYYRKVHERHNSDMDFPEGYESSYHTSGYVRDNWSDQMKVLTVIKGDDPHRYLWGERQFEPDGSIPQFRPMGQDLVVMRKRSKLSPLARRFRLTR